MEKLNVVFIGGLTNGKIVYDYLSKNKYVDLKLSITYPDDATKPRFVKFTDKKDIIRANIASEYFEEIKRAAPDYIFVAGWSELLGDDLLSIPKKGTIGFHPAKLPYDKGRSVLAWQIEEGYTETALTMFYYNESPDGGDIIAAEPIKIEENDYINDVLNKLDEATYNLMHAYFPLIRKNIAPRKKQNPNEGNFRRLRKEKDSWIDWNQNSKNIYNKVRAISYPYPGAIARINGLTYKIWSAIPVDFNFGLEEEPGRLIAEIFDGSLIIKTKDGFLKIKNYEQD